MRRFIAALILAVMVFSAADAPAGELPDEEILEEVNAQGRKVIFLGDGVPVFREAIREKITVDYDFAPVHLCMQRAGALGALAAQYYAEGKTESAREHKPDYLRLSQAERELAEKRKRSS